MSRLARAVRTAKGGAGTVQIRVSVNGARFFSNSAAQYNAEDDLLSKVKSALKDSMRSKDSFRSTVIRSLLSEHQYATKANGDNSKAVDFAGILQKAIGKRQESSKQFRAANRTDLSEKEDKEIGLIQDFLPEQMPVEEIENMVIEVLAEVQKRGVTGKKIIGEVMKEMSHRLDKSRAPGSIVSEIVRKTLPKE